MGPGFRVDGKHVGSLLCVKALSRIVVTETATYPKVNHHEVTTKAISARGPGLS